MFLSCECLCVVRQRSLRRADQSSRGVLPSVVCLSVIAKPRQLGGPGPIGAVAPVEGEKSPVYMNIKGKVIMTVNGSALFCVQWN
jgi:hypothetical protein